MTNGIDSSVGKSSQMSQGLTSSFRLTKSVRITIIFVAAYIAVNYVYITYFKEYLLNLTAIFLTSPVNLLEAYSKVYSSPLQGLQENFEIPILLLLSCELYSRYLGIRIRKTKLSFDFVFLLSVIASYITSALWWLLRGVPGHGTSIIVFCMMLFFAFECFFDNGIFFVKKGTVRSSKQRVQAILWLASFVVSVTFALSYVIANPDYNTHLLGAAVFGLLMLSYHAKKNYSRNRIDLAGANNSELTPRTTKDQDQRKVSDS